MKHLRNLLMRIKLRIKRGHCAYLDNVVRHELKAPIRFSGIVLGYSWLHVTLWVQTVDCYDVEDIDAAARYAGTIVRCWRWSSNFSNGGSAIKRL